MKKLLMVMLSLVLPISTLFSQDVSIEEMARDFMNRFNISEEELTEFYRNSPTEVKATIKRYYPVSDAMRSAKNSWIRCGNWHWQNLGTHDGGSMIGFHNPKLSPDGKFLAVDCINSIKIYDWHAQRLVSSIPSTDNRNNIPLAWSPDSSTLVFAQVSDAGLPVIYIITQSEGEDGTKGPWQMRHFRFPQELASEIRKALPSLRAIHWLPNNNDILVLELGSIGPVFFSLSTGQQIPKCTAVLDFTYVNNNRYVDGNHYWYTSNDVAGMSINPGGTHAVFVRHKHNCHESAGILDLTTGLEVARLSSQNPSFYHKGPYYKVLWHPHKDIIFAINKLGVDIWQVDEQYACTFKTTLADSGYTKDIAVHPFEDRCILSSCWGSSITEYDLTTGEQLVEFSTNWRGHSIESYNYITPGQKEAFHKTPSHDRNNQHQIYYMTYSPDGKFIIVNNEGGFGISMFASRSFFSEALSNITFEQAEFLCILETLYEAQRPISLSRLAQQNNWDLEHMKDMLHALDRRLLLYFINKYKIKA